MTDEAKAIVLMATDLRQDETAQAALRHAAWEEGVVGVRKQVFRKGQPVYDKNGEPVFEYLRNPAVLMMLCKWVLPEARAHPVREETDETEGLPSPAEVAFIQQMMRQYDERRRRQLGEPDAE